LIGVGFVLIACPQTVGDGVRSHEMTAIRTLVSLNTAQSQYFSTYGRYASSLAEMASPADLIPASLSRGVQSGYRFTMVGWPQGYVINAEPEVFNTTGRRSFSTDQSGVIREHIGNEPASVNDPEIK